MPRRGLLKVFLGVFAAALALRLLWAGFAHVTPVSDFASYDAIARHWLATGEFRDGLGVAYRTPGYPALLAGIYAAWGPDWRAVALVQAVLGALTAGLVTLIAGAVVSTRAALIAGLIQALSPVAVAYVPVLATENLATCLSVAVIACLAAREGASSAGWRRDAWSLAGGLAGGLTLLTRPASVFLTPAWLILGFRDGRQRAWRLRGGLVLMSAAALTLVPWLIRNARLGVGWSTLSTQGGIGLWWGNNPAERTGNGDGVQDYVPDLSLGERERDARCGARAWQWIRGHPAQYARLCRTRLIRMFGKEPDWVAARYLVPTAANDRRMKALADMQVGVAGVPGQLVADARVVQGRNLRIVRGLRIVAAPLVLLALVLSLARWRQYALVTLPVAFYALGIALTVFDPRYRALSDPLLAVPLAGFLSDLLFRTRELSPWPSHRVKVVLAGVAVLGSILIHASDLDRHWYRLPAAGSVDPRRAVQGDVQRTAGNQVGVGARVDDAAFVHDHDPLGHVHDGVAMGDQESRLTLAKLV
jgi:4-amino-4-deoxy-L-arabinose transferase-like glycosyltransferase